MRIDFESKPVYGDDDKYIKTKIEIYAGKCLSIIMLDSVIKANKKYHPQTFLEECKYVQENARNLEKRESDSDSNDETESDIDNDEFDE